MMGFGCAPKTTTDNSHSRMDHNGADHGNMPFGRRFGDCAERLMISGSDTMNAHHRGAVGMPALGGEAGMPNQDLVR